MNFIKPIVGQWYRDGTDGLFEVVANDDQDGTIEIQYFDGSVSEVDYEAWSEHVRDDLIETVDAPEDWSGSVDAEDLDRDFEDLVLPTWSNRVDRSLRR